MRSLLAPLFRERARWFYWQPAFLCAGIVAYFSLPFEPAFGTLAAPVFLAALMGLLHRRFWNATVFLYALFLIALGFAAAQLETRLDERPMLDHELTSTPITGRVAQTDLMPDGIRLTLLHPSLGALPAAETPERIRIKFNDLTLEDAPPTGSEVSVHGRVGPFSEPVTRGAMDFRREAYFKHLGGLGWSHDPPTQLPPTQSSLSFNDRATLFFESLRKTLAAHVTARLSGDVAAMTATRLNGEQTAISPSVIEAMRIAGLSHLLSTSGFHVTIMALLVYFPFRALLALIPPLALRFPIKKWAAGAAILSATLYTLLVGAQPATLRSLMMATLAMLAILLDRRSTPLRLVTLSAFIAMLATPDAVMGPSFQLSFAAVFCLIAAHQRTAEALTGVHSQEEQGRFRALLSYLGKITRTSVIATAATTPFALYHFQSFSLYGFLANMAAIPLTSFWIMPAILLAWLTAPFGADGIFIDAAGVGTALTIRIATTVAAWPHAVFYVPAMPALALIAVTLGGVWLCLWKERWRYIGFLPIVIGLLYPLYTRTPDFFVSSDGAWAAKQADGRLATLNVKREKFALTQWQERLGRVDAVDASALPEDTQDLRCDTLGCVYRHKDVILAMPTKEIAALEDCAHAAFVIAPFEIRSCAAPHLIDASFLKTHGSTTLFFTESGVEIDTTHTHAAERPWSVGWKKQATE